MMARRGVVIYNKANGLCITKVVDIAVLWVVVVAEFGFKEEWIVVVRSEGGIV
jgi:hypothetical protein